jgi:hypothetical protein
MTRTKSAGRVLECADYVSTSEIMSDKLINYIICVNVCDTHEKTRKEKKKKNIHEDIWENKNENPILKVWINLGKKG